MKALLGFEVPDFESLVTRATDDPVLWFYEIQMVDLARVSIRLQAYSALVVLQIVDIDA